MALPPEPLIHAALRHHQAGRLVEAEASYRQILAEDPRHADALHLFGTLAFTQQRCDEAIALIERAIAVDNTAPEFHAALAQALAGAGRVDDAIGAYRHALSLRHEMPEVHFNLGCILHHGGRSVEAQDAYRTALGQRPEFSEAHTNLGNLLRNQGQLAEAAECYRQAIQFRPQYAVAHVNLGQTLKAMGELDAAIACFDRALAINPNLAEAHSGKIYTLLYHPRSTAASLLGECRAWNEHHAAPHQSAPARKYPHSAQAINEPESPGPDSPDAPPLAPRRRLRLGYVSPDFRRHIAGFYLLPLLREHDRNQFEVFCYSSVGHADVITARFQSCADGWRDIFAMSDERAADLVRGDRIDILIDTTMHMGGNRLLLFARKPAPLQVTMCAYPGTTGLAAMDYRLTDPYLDPPGAGDAEYAERSIRLADSFWCYEPMEDSPAVGPLPAASTGTLTFGCLNNFCKVNDSVLELWAQVMRQTTASRLLLLAPRGPARQRVLETLHHLGVESSRVEFVEHQPRRQYLELYNRIDICLDTFPYNGHMTSLDAFWMGVPVVTLVGPTAVGRAGFSQLSNLGLPELVAWHAGRFIEIAARLAGDRPRLQSLRAELRQLMRKSPLMDSKRFARNVESAYQQICHEGDKVVGLR